MYPCDRCHNAAEDHPNEHANRMLCGYCSREQHYHPEACSHCRATLIGKRGSGFWEGGKGTRDKVRMSRKGELFSSFHGGVRDEMANGVDYIQIRESTDVDLVRLVLLRDLRRRSEWARLYTTLGFLDFERGVTSWHALMILYIKLGFTSKRIKLYKKKSIQSLIAIYSISNQPYIATYNSPVPILSNPCPKFNILHTSSSVQEFLIEGIGATLFAPKHNTVTKFNAKMVVAQDDRIWTI